jgi:hypothetical protein
MKILQNFTLVTVFLLGALVFGIILAWPIQWLWNNCLVGAVDGVNLIGYWQAYGLFILSNFLIKTISTSSKTK